MKKIFTLLLVLLVCSVYSETLGQTKIIQSLNKASGKGVTRLLPVLPRISIPRILPPKWRGKPDPKPIGPAIPPLRPSPKINVKALKVARIDSSMFAKHSETTYKTVRREIEAGRCDTMPAKLLWAGNYALKKGDSAFSEFCFEKAKSPYLSIDKLQPLIQKGLPHSRAQIPGLLQYMAERDFMNLAAPNFCVSDSAVMFTSSVMSEWAENYCPDLIPLIRLYTINLLDIQEQNTLIHNALKAYRDSTITYSAATASLLVDCYLIYKNDFVDSTFAHQHELSPAVLNDLFETVSAPRISPIIENDSNRIIYLANLAMRTKHEAQYNKYMSLAASKFPSGYKQKAEDMRNNIIYHLYENVVPKHSADKEEYASLVRMFCSTLPADNGDEPNMGVSELLYNITYALLGESHMPLIKHMTKCNRCSNLGHLLIAIGDYTRNQGNAMAEYVSDSTSTGLKYHHFSFAFAPTQTQHIQAVSDALDRIKKNKKALEDNTLFLTDAALILADMKAKTLEKPQEALKILKPFKKLFESSPYIPDTFYYYNYLSMLYEATGNNKKAKKYADKAEYAKSFL